MQNNKEAETHQVKRGDIIMQQRQLCSACSAAIVAWPWFGWWICLTNTCYILSRSLFLHFTLFCLFLYHPNTFKCYLHFRQNSHNFSYIFMFLIYDIEHLLLFMSCMQRWYLCLCIVKCFVIILYNTFLYK